MGNIIDTILTVSIAVGFVFYLACMLFYCIMKEEIKTQAFINLSDKKR